MNIILENQTDLEAAATLVSWLDRPMVDQVLVKLPWLDPSEQQRSEKAFKFLFNDCGCQWGSLAFLSVCAWTLFPMVQEGLFSVSLLGRSFLIGIGAALIAKLLGLGWSYWRLKVLFKQLNAADSTF